MNIAKDSIHTFFFRVFSVGLGFVITVVTTRFLDLAERGAFAMLTLSSSIYLTLFGGVSSAVVYLIANKKENPRKIIWQAALLGFAMGGITMIFILLLYPWFKSIGWNFMVYFAISAPFTLISTYLGGLLLGVNNIKTLNYVGLFSSILILLFWAFLLFTSFFNISTAFATWVMAQILSMGLTFIFVKSFIPPTSLALDFNIMKQMLIFGFKVGGTNLIGFLNYRIDMILVELFLGMGKVGIYSIAIVIAEILWFLSSSISTATYTRIGRADREEAGMLTRKALRFSNFLIIIASVGLAVGGYFLIPLVFGPNYREAVLPFEILIPGVAFFGMASILSAYFTNQMGKPHISLYIAGFSLLINVAVSLVLIPIWGLIGGALATTISYMIASTILLILFLKVSRTDLKEFIIKPSEIRMLLNFHRILK